MSLFTDPINKLAAERHMRLAVLCFAAGTLLGFLAFSHC